MRLLVVAGCAIPTVLMVWIANVPDLEVPILDHWIFFTLYDLVQRGEATALDLFTPHGRLHVTASMRIILTTLALLSNWSLRVEAIAGMSLLFLSSLALVRLSRRSTDADTPFSALAIVVTWLLMWSPVGFWAFSWTIGFVHFFTNACVIFTLVCLIPRGAEQKVSTRRFAAACAMGVVASFGRVEGLFVWIALVPALTGFGPPADWDRRRLAIWTAIGVSCWAIWAIAVTQLQAGPPGRGSGLALPGLAHPLWLPVHLFGLLGHPLGAASASSITGWQTTIAAWPAGGALVFAFTDLARRIARLDDPESVRRAIPWVCLAAYATAFCAALALGRLSVPISGDLVSIYVSMYSTTAALFAVAVVQLSAILIRTQSASTDGKLARGIVVGVGLLALASGAAALPAALETREVWRGKGVCVDLVRHLGPYNNCFFGKGLPRNDIDGLERSGFRSIAGHISIAPANPPLRGQIVDRSRFGDGRARLSGWAEVPADIDRVHIVLSRADAPESIAWVAYDVPLKDGRVEWTVVHAATENHTPGSAETLRLWAYDRDRAELTPISMR